MMTTNPTWDDVKYAWLDYVAIHGREAAKAVDKAAAKTIREQGMDADEAIKELLRKLGEHKPAHQRAAARRFHSGGAADCDCEVCVGKE